MVGKTSKIHVKINSMNNKTIIWIIIAVIFFLISFFIIKNEIGSVNIPPAAEETNSSVTETQNAKGLKTPEGFRIEIFAEDLPEARVIEFDDKGRMLVSQTREGKITILENKNEEGFFQDRRILVDNLRNPHGMAWQCPSDSETCFLYVAESDKLTRFSYDSDSGTVSEKTKMLDINYSSSDRHFTRSLLFLPYPNENTLLISVGSSCNVCQEKDDQRGRILAYDTKTGNLFQYASGLRNAVFMTLNFVDGKVFATEMGRDALGDDLPPDEINIIEEGKNYGWPVCYGKNIHDTDFDKNTYIRNPCSLPFETSSFVDLQAHSAPLGLSFIPEEGWPEEYWYDLLVAYHGSWNRSVPTGYKIVRINMKAEGKYLETEDFITGWLNEKGEKTGRPVDIKVFSGGVGYISDDEAGVIYRFLRE